VVFDKTGTLTEDSMSVQAVTVREGVTAAQALRWAAALAQHSLHPASRAVVAAAGAAEDRAVEVREHAGRGVEGVLSGAGQPGWLRLGSAAFCDMLQPATDGGSQVHLADRAGWLASFTLDEALRPGARESIAALQRQGLAVALLSGDRAEAVARLARRAGIATQAGEQTPEGKLARVEALQRAGHRVAMVGDGMNDGPVLARADLSFAMGQAVPVAQARADVVVLGGQPDAVALVLRQARRTRRVVRQNLAWAAGYNAVCVPLALAGMMPPWLAGLGMAASSLVVVLNAARLSVIPGLPRTAIPDTPRTVIPGMPRTVIPGSTRDPSTPAPART
jgi:Cu2+-exporting ATPase